MNKQINILILILFISLQVVAQKDTIKYEFGTSAAVSTGTNSPFLLQSNSYGLISNSPTNGILSAAISKDFSAQKSLFNYAFNANLIMHADNNKTTLYFHEIYAKVKLSFLDFTIGSSKEIIGNQDSTLSSGGFLFSKNARPMPKITVGIENFTNVPFTNGFVEIKGALSHGWFTDNTYVENVLLHHKYAYVRLGGNLPIHIQYGLDHAAQWGGNIPGWGVQHVSFQNYKSIFFGKSGGTDANISDQINALGNHIISQSMKFELNISDYKLNAYWQNISEDGPIRPIWNTMNIKDGLWGVSIKNKKFPLIQGILYEYLNTTDQSGPYHDKDGIVYGGADGYFSGQYQTGWSFYSRTIGTPFILAPKLNETTGGYYPYNNRVQAHHVGIEGQIAGYDYKLLSSFSKNYGIYKAPLNLKNTSIMFEIYKTFPKIFNLQLGGTIAADYGNLYGNSFGCMISIKKIGKLFNY